jgi:hypothetical protein
MLGLVASSALAVKSLQSFCVADQVKLLPVPETYLNSTEKDLHLMEVLQ